jgi:hypothetical protein
MKPGQQLESSVCTTKVIVVRAPGSEVTVACGGRPVREPGGTRAGATSAGSLEPGEGTVLGKRYVDKATGLDVLCVTAGAGSLTCNGTPMVVQGAKPLPSSD